jgi:bifunctional non-homologous end joining protein LigD
MGKRNGKKGPAFVRPMLCKSVAELPTGNEWLYEVKRGGRRSIAVKDGRRVKVFAADGKRLDCPDIEEAVRRVNRETAVIDGEIVAFGSQGEACDTDGECRLQLCAFDLLHLDGKDLIHEPIERRKSKLCTATLDSSVLYCPSLRCAPNQLLEEIRQLSLEGVIAKRKGSLYEPGQSTGAWVNLRVSKCRPRK